MKRYFAVEVKGNLPSVRVFDSKIERQIWLEKKANREQASASTPTVRRALAAEYMRDILGMGSN